MTRIDNTPATFTLLLSAASRCRLYGPDHQLTGEAIRDLSAALHEIMAEERTVRITVAGDQVICNDRRYSAISGPGLGLARRLSSKGIGLLEFQPGVSLHELKSLCTAIGNPGGGQISSHPNIKLGTAKVDITPVGGGPGEVERARVQNVQGTRKDEVSEEAHELMRLTRHIQDHYEVQVKDYKQIAYTLLAHLTRHGNLFLQLAEVRDHHLFTYLHTCNVSTLTMGFAMDLEIGEQEAYDIGMAALLHDIGKLFIPREILDKPGKLSLEEWELITRHPEEGARLLLKEPTVNHLAVVAAYEHHMHHDGVGGYPSASHLPSIQAQLIAVTDTFDALFGSRSYHRKFDVLEALEILASERGTTYSPALVDEFTRYIHSSMETPEWIELSSKLEEEPKN